MSENNTMCQYCGKSLKGLFRESGRKYCSRPCRDKAMYQKKYPNRAHKLWVHEKNVFETAMELHWSGEESGAIARRLSIPVGTVYSWVHDFGSRRQRKEPLKKLLQTAASADEWLEALRGNTPGEFDSYAESTIQLVCGTFHGQSAPKLTSIIYEGLHENPLSGSAYAFCNKMRNTITVFAWKSPVFNITKHIKMHGTFMWPHEDLGKTIEVTKAEFYRLLSVNKQEILAERISKNLEVMRVSCYN